MRLQFRETTKDVNRFANLSRVLLLKLASLIAAPIVVRTQDTNGVSHCHLLYLNTNSMARAASPE